MIYVITGCGVAAFVGVLITLGLKVFSKRYGENKVVSALLAVCAAVFVVGTSYCVLNRNDYYDHVENKAITLEGKDVQTIEEQLSYGNPVVEVDGKQYHITDVVYDTSNPDTYIDHNVYSAPIVGEKQKNTLHIGVNLE